MDKSYTHFSGKKAPEHLQEARVKGFLASREVHGTELSGFMASFTDAAKENTTLLLLLWIISSQSWKFSIFFIFIFSFSLWKMGRSAFLGWSRMERLHRVIEEERWEIEHHRPQEREELTAMYAAKGLQGKLLEETIDVLMADDHRLLNIMLEEELGLTLEVYEHPLRQACGAFLGVLFSGAFFMLALFLKPTYGPFISTAIAVSLLSWGYARKERNAPLPAVVWSLSIAFLTLLTGYLLLFVCKR